MENFQELFSLSKIHKWVIIINNIPVAYVNNKREAKILISAITRNLLKNINNSKLQIGVNGTRYITNDNINNRLYVITMHKMHRIGKLVENRRISQIKHYEKNLFKNLFL